ncbi:MAG: hypothetical protein AAFW60_12780 [Pseudomonadota bacterium]
MNFKYAISGFAILGLSACGGSDDSPQIEAADPPPIEADESETETATAASPGYGPPALEYAEDGDTIEARLDEEFSFKLPLPDNVSTAVNWYLVDGSYEPVVRYDKTWRAMEGSTRYSEIVLVAEQAGETTVTYQVQERGQRVGDDERTLTLVIRE